MTLAVDVNRCRRAGAWTMVLALAVLGSGCRDDGNDHNGLGAAETADAANDAPSASSDATDTTDATGASGANDATSAADDASASDTTVADADSRPPNGTVAAGSSTATTTTIRSQATTSTQAPTSTQPPTTTLPPTTTTTQPPVDAGTAAFCDAIVGAQTAYNRGPEIDFANSTPEEIAAAVETNNAEIEPLLDQASASAPAAIAADVETAVTAIRDSLDSGADLTSDDVYQAADEAVDLFVAGSCGYPTITVSGVEYAFAGLPATVPAGRTTFAFTNNGAEIHEMVVFRINDGVAETIDELLALPEDEALAKVRFVGSTFGAQGTTDVETLELTPGKYVALCFVPVGTTAVETDEGNAEPLGPPHFTEGMQATFTVT